MSSATMNLEFIFTDVYLHAQLHNLEPSGFKPFALVLPASEKIRVEDHNLEKTVKEAMDAMASNKNFEKDRTTAHTLYRVNDALGWNFVKLYNVDVHDPNQQFFLINASSPPAMLANCAFKMINSGHGVEMKSSDQKIKMNLKKQYATSETFEFICDCDRIERQVSGPIGSYGGEGEFVDDPNDKVKIFNKKKGKILNENKLLTSIIEEMKDVNLGSIVKSLNSISAEFNKCVFFQPEFRPMDSFGRSKQILHLISGKNKSRLCSDFVEQYIDFLRYFYSEKGDLRPERMHREFTADIEGEERQGEQLLYFRNKELEDVRVTQETRNMLAKLDPVMNILMNGFDLSKAPKIVEKSGMDGFGFGSFFKESKGDELKKAVKLFIEKFIKNPKHLLIFAIRVIRATLQKDANRVDNVIKLINYFYKEFIEKYTKEFTFAIENFDQVREDYFKLSISIIEVLCKSEEQQQDWKCIQLLITDTVLEKTPNLPNEFFKMLFARTSMLTKDVFKMYFSSPLIDKDDKGQMMLFFMSLKDGISLSLADMIEEFIVSPATIKDMNIKNLFTALDAKYYPYPKMLDDFIRKNKNCNLHRSVLSGINRVMKSKGHPSRDFLKNQKDSYFMNLYNQILDFIRSCKSDLLIEYINEKEFLNFNLVKYLEPFTPEDFTGSSFSDCINGYIRRLDKIKKNLAFYIKVLEKNEKYMLEYEFLEPLLVKMRTFRDTINTFTVVSIESDKSYIDCNCLYEKVWNVYYVCQEYIIFYKELKEKCPKTISFTDYKATIDKHCLELKDRFIGFLKDDNYTLANYYYHFRRIMFKENIDIYQAATEALGLTESQRETLFNHSRAFHALHKVLKLKESIDKILAFPFLKINSSKYIENISKIYQKFNGKQHDAITYKQVEQADKETGILVAKDHQTCKSYLLPLVIRHLAVSPDTLNFMKEKGDDFIKSMRDECDNENLEIINKLDVLNKNLNFLVKDDNIDSILEKLILIPKTEQRKIKDYIKSIEGLVMTHIIHLADKTKKDTGYNRKTITHILDKCHLVIKFSIEAKDYVTRAKYFIGSAQFTVDSIELGELFNKAKIITNENMNKEQELDDYQLIMFNFNLLGKELVDLMTSFKALRQLGLVNYKFNDMIEFLNKHSATGTFSANTSEDNKDNEATELTIEFGKDNGGTDNLTKVNASLRELVDNLTTELYKYYSQQCYLFTYFYGKKLYYLIEYLRGRLNDDEAEECLNLIREAFPENSLNFTNNYMISRNIDEVLKDVYYVLIDWSKQISAKTNIKLNTSCVFQMMKIVVVVDPVENKYKTMIKIMAEAKENIFSLSQVLFCRPDTTRNEIYSFCKRSLLDPFKRIYFIMNIHVLEYYLLLELRNFINKIIEFEGENVNYNLLIFADQTEYHKDLLDNENFCRDLSIPSVNQKVTDTDIRNKYSHIFTANQMVMSTVAGMGKTTYIRDKTKTFDLVELFLSGELQKNTITKRLRNLAKNAKQKNKLAINIKLDFIEDFTVYTELVDYTLFSVSLVNRYYTDRGCKDLRGNLKMIFFEIGNTFSAELLSALDTLKIFNVDHEESEQSMHQYKVIMPSFDLKNTVYDEDLKSQQQIVANFFLSLEENDYFDRPLEDRMKVIPKEQFHELLSKYFMVGKSKEDKENITYAQYTFWLKAIALLVTEFEKVEKMKPQYLDSNQLPKDVRTEIAGELNMFVAQIINLSVSQAKSSQDEMKKILSNLSKEEIKMKKMEEYKNKFTNLDQWDSKDMLVPLLGGGRILLAHTNLDLFNKEGSMRYRKRLNLKTFIRKEGSYVDHEKYLNSSDLYLDKLAGFLGMTGDKVTELKKRTKEFKGGKGFCITKENYMKICLIILKAELKTPIIMMGESGCGKTYVSQFVSQVLLEEELRELTLYSGVSEADFVSFMKDAIVRANELKEINKRLWIFFDEFNTSCLQSIVAEIMLDRKCPIDLDIYDIPENIVFISCCNPYRMKTKKADVGLVPKTTDNLLSHRVYPIPERLINFIWDFGQLSDKDEYVHLMSIIEAAKIFDPSNQGELISFCNLIYTCHKFVRDLEERSGVSLRDIKRVITIYNWFKGTLVFYEKEVLGKSKENTSKIHINASIAATMICYGLRLNGRPEQTEFIRKLVQAANNAKHLNRFSTQEVKSILSDIAQNHFDQLIDLKAGIIPDGIALNTPLKENFIAMLACFDTLTPLIICGAPGTSKTLCTQIFNSALTPNVIKKCKIFSRYKGINSMYYGGSQTSTSEGISKVFQRGDKYLKNRGEDRPVVVFDEIGLAELSPYNPLKILHPLLERVDVEVGFLGLSNWTLDLSKMNRLIYLARPDMTKEDLLGIFYISIAKCQNENIKGDLERFLSYLTTAYLKFRNWQKKYGGHPNFHGSRDIYGVSKFIYQNMLKIKFYDTSVKAKELIKLAIERNFNGAIYLFGENPPAVNPDTIQNLKEGFQTKTFLSMLRVKEIGDPYNTKEDRIDHFFDMVEQDQDVAIYNSTEVFKKLFMNEIEKDPSANLFAKDFLSEFHVLDMVNMNIKDNNARFLLIKSEGEVIDNIFLEKLREVQKKDRIIDWRGIKGKENSVELLSTLKSYINFGYVVVMKNLDELYGSLYDLFNQKYMEVDGRQYCYLYYGENKHRVEVHPDFKAIVILPAEKELEGLDVELEQPAPFLNRFEKFFLRISNILSENKIKELIYLRNYLKNQVKGYSSRVLALSIDMLASMVVNKQDIGQIEGSQPAEAALEVSSKNKTSIMKLTTLNYLLYDDLTTEHVNQFLNEHPYTNLKSVFKDMESKNNYKLCLMTFSNPMELEPMKKPILEEFGVNILSSEELYTLGLEKRSSIVKNYRDTTFAVQFIYTEHLSMISQLKSNIEQNAKITKAIFLIHLERDPSKRAILKSNIGINYWNEWDNRVLDNIQATNYEEYCQIRGLTFEELLLSTNYSIGINLFKEVIMECIIKITYDKTENQGNSFLQLNMFNIRKLIDKDENNTFVNCFREKMKKSNIFKKDDMDWVKIVYNRTLNKDFYVDLDVELLSYFSTKYSEIVKKYLIRLNDYLANIASYSIGFLSDNEEIKQFFITKLKEGIEACSLTEAEVNKVVPRNRRMMRGTPPPSYFRLPFLNSVYVNLSKSIEEGVINQNRAEFSRLSESVLKLKVAVLYGVAKEQIEGLRKKITNAEAYLVQCLEQTINPVLEDITKKLGPLASQPQIQLWLETDLISIAAQRITTNQSEEILAIFRLICLMLNSKAEGNVKLLFATACLLSISLEKQMMFLFDMMSISNFKPEEINTFRQNLTIPEDRQSLNYESIDQFVNYCQEKLIPEFGDVTINLRLFREKYEKLIERLRSDNHQLTDSDPNIYNFRSLINLFGLLDILPNQNKLNYLSRLKDIRNNLQRFGSGSHLSFIQDQILLIFFESSDIKQIDSNEYCLILSEYVVINAAMYRFHLFTEDKYDQLFSRFTKLETEKIACTLGSYIASKIPDFYSVDSLKRTLDVIEKEHEFQEYNKLLLKIDNFKPRNLYFLVSLIDYLYIKGMNSPGRIYNEQFIELLEFIFEESQFKTTANNSYKSLRNIIFYALLRTIFNSDIINQHLLEREDYQKAIENTYLPISRSKEYFTNNPDCYKFTYFIQSIIREFGDLGTYQPKFPSINNICTLILDEDVQGTITFMEKDMRDAFVMLRDELDDAAYKKETDKMSNIFSRGFNGDIRMQHYMIGVVLINKFVNAVKQTDAAVVQNLKSSYISAFNNLSLNPKYISLLKLIVDDTSMAYSEAIGSDTDLNYNIRLRKTFLQFLLVTVLFENFGYDYTAWKEWDKEIQYPHFKCKLVNTERLNNACAVCENIIIERLADGSYQDYGGNLTKNLGIYKCACGYIYSIGNCGYAVMKSKCPKCGKDIGGENHQMLNAEGHVHLKKLEDIFKIIQQEYFKNSHYYNLHTVINHTSLEFFPMKIIEIPEKEFMENRKVKANNPYWQVFYVNMFLRHLFDHMYLTIIPETLGDKEEKQGYFNKLGELINFNSKNVQELYGSMAGKKINSEFEYLLAHVKNDISVLSKELHFENPVDIFDWLRAIMSILVEKMHHNKNDDFKDSKKRLAEQEYITEPGQLLILQEKNINLMVNTDFSVKNLVKSMYFRKIDGDALYRYNQEQKEEMHSIYQFCRHNKYDRVKLMDSFNKQLQNTECRLLKDIVKYNYLLREFPRMVTANLELSYYLMNNYNRLYTFEEAVDLDILTLPDPRLHELFKEFRTVWEEVIPKYEDTNPEVFSFAFMCQQNLAVDSYIKRLLEPGGAKLSQLILVRSSDVSSQELLYMKGILETLIKKFHNMLVEKIYSVLQIKEEDFEKTLPEFCDEGSFMTSFNYEPLIESNFWYNTDTAKENEIYFDLKRIEYLCAKAMRKKWVSFEEQDLKYYEFRNMNKEANENLIENMLKKIQPLQLEESIEKGLDDLDEASINKSYDFLMEIGEYIYQNFLFYDSEKLIKAIIEDISSDILRKRFTNFDERLHSKLRVGHLIDYFSVIREKKFDFFFRTHRGDFNKPLSVEDKMAFSELFQDPNLTGTVIEDMKREIKDCIREYYTQGNQFLAMTINNFVYPGDVHPGADFIGDLRFDQYLEIADILNEGFKLRTKSKVISRTSSNLYRRHSNISQEASGTHPRKSNGMMEE